MDIQFIYHTVMKLLAALPITLELFICSLILGLFLALVILALRINQNPLLSYFARGYILVFRGTPLLIQLFVVYYGLGQLEWIQNSFLWPIFREPFNCAVLSIALCTAGYTAEIFRGALLSVPSGQIEAGKACGMSRALLIRRIIAPIMIRYALPAYSTEAIMLIKSTTLASLVTVWEVTGVAQQIIQRTYRTMEVFICAAVIYLIINYVIVKIYGCIENKLTVHTKPADQMAEPKAISEESC